MTSGNEEFQRAVEGKVARFQLVDHFLQLLQAGFKRFYRLRAA